MAMDVTGINTSGAAQLKKGLQTYKSELNKALDSISNIDSSVLNKAIKGASAQTKFKQMVSRAKEQAKRCVAQLDEFSRSLDTVITSYEQSEQVSGVSSFDSVAR